MNKPRKIFDFEQNGGIEQRNGKNQNRKIGTNREIFLTLNEMSELSNETEKTKTEKLEQTEKYLLVL